MSAAAVQHLALARTLGDQAAARSSGILKATRGKLRRVFCFENGLIVFAASNLVEEQLGEHLMKSGLLPQAQKAVLVEAAAKGGKKLAQVLMERRVLGEEDLRRSMGELVHSLLASTLEWPDGSYEFENGRPNLDGEVTVRVSPISAILQHVRRRPAQLDAVRVRIGPPDSRPERVPERADPLASADLGTAVSFLMARCDGSLAVTEILSRSPASTEETLRMMYGLLLLGVLRLSQHGKQASHESILEPAAGREECLAVLAKVEGADHYGVLGLYRTAGSDEVRKAYYSLARRYHPDRFRVGELRDLLPRIEDYFSRVTEAYNTLFHAELREEYDRQLATATREPEGAKQSETSYLARQNYLRGKSLVEKRKFAEAATFLENAARLDSGQAAYHLDLGLVLSRNPRRRADAERHLIRAAELEPASTAAYLALGQLYQRAGKLGPAARMYREVLRWDAGHAEASALLAEVGNPPDEPGAGGVLKVMFGE